MLFVLSCPTFVRSFVGLFAASLLLFFVAPKLTTISFHLLSEVNSSVPRSFIPPLPCPPLPCLAHTHTLPPHFLSFCAAAVGWFDYIDCQCRLESGKKGGRRGGGPPGVNVLGFNFSSTSARRYSLNCIVHSQLLPIYSANAFCTNKLNQFNCPRGEGWEKWGRGGLAKLICAFVCQSEKYEILVSKFLEHFICICYYFVGLPVAVAILV